MMSHYSWVTMRDGKNVRVVIYSESKWEYLARFSLYYPNLIPGTPDVWTKGN